MKTAILFASSKGYCASCAEKLKNIIQGGTELLNLKKIRNPDLSSFDGVIIGGSIHAGNIQGVVKKYCSTHEAELLGKKHLGLFLCAMEEQQIEAYFTQFPEGLRKKAAVTGWFGGRIDLSQHNFLVRKLLKKVAGMQESVSAERPEEIETFGNSFNSLESNPG